MYVAVLVLGMGFLIVVYLFIKDIRFYFFCKSDICKKILLESQKIEDAMSEVENILNKELNYFEAQLLEIFFYENRLKE